MAVGGVVKQDVTMTADVTRGLMTRATDNAVPVLAGGMLAALLLAWLLRDAVLPLRLYGWLTLLLFSYLVWGVVLLLRRDPADVLPIAFAGGLTGMVWGSTSLLFAPLAPMAQPLLLLVPALVASAALLSHTALRWSGSLFIAAVLLPLAARCFYLGDEAHQALGLIVLLYAAALLALLHYTHGIVAAGLAAAAHGADLEQALQRYRSNFVHARRVAELGEWEWDLNSSEIRCSAAACALLGLEDCGRLTPQTLLGVIHWEDRATFQYSVEQAVRSGGLFSREFRVELRDGRIRVLRDAGEVVRDGNGRPALLLGVMSDITERVTAEQKTRSTLQELNRILNHMQDTYYRADPVGRISSVSRSMLSLLGYLPEECIGKRIAELYAVAGYGKTFLDDLHARGGVLRNYEIHMRHKNGQRVWVSVNAQFIHDDKGRVVGLEGTIRDIDELKQAQQALHHEKERALVTLQSIGDGVVTTDEFGKVDYLNPTAERLLRVTAAKAVGQHHRDVLRLVDEATGESLGDLVRICLTLDAGTVHADEGLLIQSDGSRYHLKVTAAPMRDHFGHVVGAVLALHDITEVMGMARQLSYQATHDMLTGLYNRRVFEKRTEEKIREAQAGGGSSVLFYMDLDQFKVVNDTCGHKAGDELLEQIAQLMQQRVRETDVLARLGGDEFGVLLEHCPLDKACLIAEGIRASVRDYRFAWDDKSFDIGVSIGVVPIASDSGNLADVLAAADAACYVAKDHGRNRIHVYQPDDLAVAQRHGEMEWVHRLSSAFDNERFVLYAQPVAHIAGDRVVSHYEVLLRMVDEGGRVVPPGAFIPAAERYNLMPTIDRWVIRETFAQLRQAQGDLAFPPVECAINLSGQSLCDEHFLEYVIDLFERTGIPCESICFEVTETSAIANLTRATRFMTVLRGMGCSFALDDFGSGLSSFGYLKTLPVDYLKIDGGFVRDMVVDKVDRAMVESINQVGHVLGLKTIAEFAESEAVLMALEKAGVDYAQGSGIANPSPFSEILALETRQHEKADTSYKLQDTSG
jgi:diguanylate cyclase (GGDEF)-like protein/PAS domain S-box-containing protein